VLEYSAEDAGLNGGAGAGAGGAAGDNGAVLGKVLKLWDGALTLENGLGVVE
jgi:hypothetical protein